MVFCLNQGGVGQRTGLEPGSQSEEGFGALLCTKHKTCYRIGDSGAVRLS
jgi:hypothetical protein